MKTLVIGSAGLVVALALCGGNSLSQPTADEKPAKEKSTPIPLDSIYSTSVQKGLRRLPRPAGRELRNALDELHVALVHMDISNVFLARGGDIQEAVKATERAFTWGQPVEQPVTPEDRVKPETIWLVAYLGVASSVPSYWLVQSAEVRGNTVRITYARGGAFTPDSREYLYWVPLGKLGVGSYCLELFDADQNAVTLMRRVSVPKK